MNKLILGLILGLLISGIGVGIYFGYQYEKTKWLNQGYESGVLTTINQIQTTGNIPYMTNETGNWTIKSIAIKDICTPKQ